MELYGLVQRLVFRASVSLLFGPTFLKRGGRDRLHALFCDFDGGFEMAASPVPHVLQPRFVAARRRLLAALRCAVQGFGWMVRVLLSAYGERATRSARNPSW